MAENEIVSVICGIFYAELLSIITDREMNHYGAESTIQITTWTDTCYEQPIRLRLIPERSLESLHTIFLWEISFLQLCWTRIWVYTTHYSIVSAIAWFVNELPSWWKSFHFICLFIHCLSIIPSHKIPSVTSFHFKCVIFMITRA